MTVVERADQLVTKSDLLLEPNSSAERNYCYRYGIELIRLSNGATIVGAAEGAPLKVESDTHFYIPRGSRHDPPGKEGLHHLFEHLQFFKLLQLAGDHEVEANANTGHSWITMYALGVANPDFSDFGLWPIADELRRRVAHPLQHLPDFDKILDQERNTIIDLEMERDARNPQKRRLSVLVESIYHPLHPEQTPLWASEESYRSITVDDIVKCAHAIGPNGLLASIYSEGRSEIVKKLIAMVKESIGSMSNSRNDTSKEVVLNQTTHPDLSSGALIRKDTGGKVAPTICLVWVVNAQPYSQEYFGYNAMTRLLRTTFLSHMREKRGLSYTTFVHNLRVNEFQYMFVLGAEVRNRADLGAFAQGEYWDIVRRDVIGGLNESSVEQRLWSDQMLIRARPTTKMDRLRYAEEGLTTFGRIPDVKLIHQARLRVGVPDVLAWGDYLLAPEHAPTILVLT